MTDTLKGINGNCLSRLFNWRAGLAAGVLAIAGCSGGESEDTPVSNDSAPRQEAPACGENDITVTLDETDYEYVFEQGSVNSSIDFIFLDLQDGEVRKAERTFTPDEIEQGVLINPSELDFGDFVAVGDQVEFSDLSLGDRVVDVDVSGNVVATVTEECPELA